MAGHAAKAMWMLELVRYTARVGTGEAAALRQAITPAVGANPQSNDLEFLVGIL